MDAGAAGGEGKSASMLQRSREGGNFGAGKNGKRWVLPDEKASGILGYEIPQVWPQTKGQ